MSQLRLFLLGTPEVKHNDQLLTFSTRKAQALLFYLAVEGGRYSRQRLSESLWPELDAEHGRAALRATLQQLRKLLDRTHLADERPHLNVEQGTISLEQVGVFFLDLQIIESVCRQVRKVEQGQERMSPEAQNAFLEQMEQATRLVRGPFLEGFSLRDSQFFDDWTRQHREYWHQRILRLFEALAMFYEKAGDIEHAIETVDRWLVFDPLHEAGYRSLMHLRFSQGDRTGALRAFTTCRTSLSDELQMEPEPETLALAKRIRLTIPRRVHVSAHCLSMQHPSTLLDKPFVGRASEFSMCIDCYQRTRTGQAQIILLEGEAGIGKTRLVTEFLNWAQAQGADVLEGRPLQTGDELPYQPLIDAMRLRLAQENAPNDLLSEVWLAQLSRLLPELRDLAPDLPPCTTDPVVGKNLLFEATSRLLRSLAANRPLVLFLDDVQWADRATRDLLLYLAQSLTKQRAPILLIFSLQSATLCRSVQTTTWLAELKRISLPVNVMALAALSKEDVRSFVQALPWVDQQAEVIDNSLPGRNGTLNTSSSSTETLEGFIEWIYSRTHGQPFYLVETLKAFLKCGVILPSLRNDGTWDLALRSSLLDQNPDYNWLPSSVREHICQQLQQLSASACMLLRIAAVLHCDLTLERLCCVARMDEQDCLQALEELLGNGFLLEGTSEEGLLGNDQFTFAYEMVRKAISQEVGPTRQRLVQQRAQGILETKEKPATEIHHSTKQPNRDLEMDLNGLNSWQELSNYRTGTLARVISPTGFKDRALSSHFNSRYAFQGRRVRIGRTIHSHTSLAKPRPPPD